MWTIEDDLRLLNYSQQDFPVAVYARILKRTQESCATRLRELQEWKVKTSQVSYCLSERRDTSLCILCPKTRIPRVFGKKHQTLIQIRQTSKACITIHPYIFDEDMIIVSSSEICELHSPVLDAAFLLLPLCADPSSGALSIKLLVEEVYFSECLHPHLIYEIKSVTKCEISVTSMNNKQIIQMIGASDAVKKAFTQFVLKLRTHAFKIYSQEEDVSRFSAELRPATRRDL